MSRKKREGDSSLELLLDTMCNTFGGVMFIAIALVVIMAMLGKVEKQLDLEAERAELQQKIEELKRELQQSMARNRDLEIQLQRLKNDPRREWIEQLLQQERLLRQERILHQALQSQQKLAVRSAQEAERRRREAAELHTRLKKERQERLALRRKLEQENAKIQSDPSSAPVMTFRVMERSDLPPYYLIVEKDRLFRIGPETMRGPGAMTPHADCRYEKKSLGGKLCYLCTPGSAGTPILENGTVSAGAIALLKAIPAGRAPYFSLDKASMKSFCLLREYLKNGKILHGVDTGYETLRSFSYILTSKAEYEY